MKSVQRWAIVSWLFLGGWVFAGTSFAAMPTAGQLQLLQQMSDDDLVRLEQVVKDRRTTPGENPLAESTVQVPVVSPRDPYVAVGDGSDAALKPFGYDLFAGVPSTFAPASAIPVAADYVIGPGDVVEVQLFGNTNASYSLRVDRRGTITFPSVGAITVAGMSFDDMRQLLKQRVAQQFIGVEASITLGELRSMRVFVLGDVQRPGSYVVSSLSTMTNALFVSGGVKLIGSLRDVQLKRSGKLITRLDLYDLLLRGDTQHDKRLQPGDVIFVPPVGDTVAIEGEVRRPAIYELRRERKLDELIELAGGLLPDAYPNEVRLERISAGHERTLVDIDLGEKLGQTTALRNGDVIHVFSVLEKLENVVMLSGHVQRPLAYQWSQGLRLTDIIPATDLLKADADLDYVLIRRQDKAGQGVSLLSASLADAMAEPGGESDTLLRPDDRVIVFSLEPDPESTAEDEEGRLTDDGRQKVLGPLLNSVRELATAEHPAQVVGVGGHVRFPGSYPLDRQMRVSDLIRAAGKLRESAYTLKAELTRRQLDNGQTQNIRHISVDLSAVLAGQVDADVILQPYDYLSVREIPQWREQEYMDVRGEVLFPGRYPIRQGETLADIVQRAGGLTRHAFIEGAVFVRKKLRERESEQLSRMADNLERELAGFGLKQAQMQPEQQQAYQFAQQLVSRIRHTKAVGRLVIDLEKVLQREDSQGGLAVVDGDALYIPTRHEEVTVMGEVFFPTSHLFQKGKSRGDYIGRSGGLTANADDKRIYVVRANGSVESGKRGFWSRKPKIKAGDTIIVPLDADRVNPIRLWTDVTQILYQLSLTAASMRTLGVF